LAKRGFDKFIQQEKLLKTVSKPENHNVMNMNLSHGEHSVIAATKAGKR
jgi:hypothetical protein